MASFQRAEHFRTITDKKTGLSKRVPVKLSYVTTGLVRPHKPGKRKSK